MASGPAGRTPDLVADFFSKARPVYLGEANYGVLGANEIVKIAADPQACADFVRSFAKDTQDRDFQMLVIDYMRNVADYLEDLADKSELSAQTIDKVGLPLAFSVTGVGIASIVASGGASIPVAVAFGGLLCLAAAGVGGLKIRHAIWKRKVASKQIRKLIAKLG